MSPVTPERARRIFITILDGKYKGISMQVPMAPRSLLFNKSPKWVDHDIVGTGSPVSHYTQGGLAKLKMDIHIDGRDRIVQYPLFPVRGKRSLEASLVPTEGNVILRMEKFFRSLTLPRTFDSVPWVSNSEIYIGPPRIRIDWTDTMIYTVSVRDLAVEYTEFWPRTNEPSRGMFKLDLAVEEQLDDSDSVLDELFVQKPTPNRRDLLLRMLQDYVPRDPYGPRNVRPSSESSGAERLDRPLPIIRFLDAGGG